MKMTDSDCKGNVMFKTNRGTYFGLKPEELEAARKEIDNAIAYRDSGKPRFFMDKRKY